VNFCPGCGIPTNSTVKLPIGADGANRRKRAIRLAKGNRAVSSPGVSIVGRGQRLLLRHAGNDGYNVHIVLPDGDV